MGKKYIFLGIIGLVLMDQGIKLIIANNFMDTSFYIMEPILGFRPVFNANYSFINSALRLNIGVLAHFIYLIICQLLIVFLYGYYRNIQRSTKLLDVSYIFGQAALICVFSGFFFWEKGVLDFIFLYPLTIDFKDIYLNCLIVLLLLNHYINKKERVVAVSAASYFKQKISRYVS